MVSGSTTFLATLYRIFITDEQFIAYNLNNLPLKYFYSGYTTALINFLGTLRTPIPFTSKITIQFSTFPGIKDLVIRNYKKKQVILISLAGSHPALVNFLTGIIKIGLMDLSRLYT